MLLSLCIPTKDRVEILKDTLESIYLQGVDNSLFEVVISDNSEGDETKLLAKEYKDKGMSINYFKSNLHGFYNSITVMNAAKGKFIKLHNNYTKFRPGALRQLIDIISCNLSSKPQLLFTDGNLNRHDVSYYNDFDSFMYSSGYWNTWSSAFSIWKDDLDILEPNAQDLNANFPHTDLLFLNADKNAYGIVDVKLFDNTDVKQKGGYNIFKLFCVTYIDMLYRMRDLNHLSEKTINEIKRKLRNDFIPQWLQKSVFTDNGLTFDNENFMRNIATHFSLRDQLIIGVLTTKFIIVWHIKRILAVLKLI